MNRDDLDSIVSNPNAATPQTVSADQQTTRLRSWLKEVVSRSGSDLLLVAGAPPSIRVEGVVVPLKEGPLDGDGIAEAVTAVLPPHALRQYRDTGITDASYRSPDLGRFRINLHRERGHAAAAIRRLPAAVPRLVTLELPPSV